MTSKVRFSAARRIIVKTGSALISDAKGHVREHWLGQLAEDIAHLRRAGKQIVLVTSGAVALGRAGLGKDKFHSLDEKQAAAAIGQPRLMQALSNAFAPHQIEVAQALLTPDDTEQRRRWLNARATLETLLEAGCLPVINENDTVATEELRYGDNDRLAARVAQMLSADLLVLLSDVDGLYTADPSEDANARHIAETHVITEAIMQMAAGANSQKGVGSGGMVTKLQAAKIAQSAGCATVITRGDRAFPLQAVTDGALASWILPDMSPANARKAWLEGHIKPEGAVTIDAGAARAVQAGASLLPIGIVAVDGQFERGAAILLKTETDQIIAKGITAYTAQDIRRIAGYHSHQIEARLGMPGRPAIIHRNDLVLTS